MNLRSRNKFSLINFFVIIFSIIILSSCSSAKKHKKRYEISYNSLANKGLCVNCEVTIPKIFHRIWLPFSENKASIPLSYKKLDSDLLSLHPGWQMIQWKEEEINILIQKYYPEFWPVYSSYDVPIKKHDAARYIIIHHYGGIFLQHSIILNKNIEPLLMGYEAVFSEQSIADNTIASGFIASIPNHPIMSEIIMNLPKIKNRHVLQATGPYVISHFVHKYMDAHKENNIQVLPTKYIFPFDWNEKNKDPRITSCIKSRNCGKLFPESYGYCLWSASWQQQYHK